MSSGNGPNLQNWFDRNMANNQKSIDLGGIFLLLGITHVFTMGTYIGWPPFLPEWLAWVTLFVAGASGLACLVCLGMMIKKTRP